MSTANYSSIHNIKDFAIKELAPKYFDVDDINDLNIGLLGYVTELNATHTEDAFNTVSVLMNEMFPNLAILPETIYTNASLFHIDDIFTTPSEMSMVLFIPEKEVIEKGRRVSSGTALGDVGDSDLFEFFIDSRMIINVEDIPFLMDYDIKINYKPYRNDYVFTAQYYRYKYEASYSNTVSKVSSPYLKIKRINYEKEKYLAIQVNTHQLTRFSKSENIISNDIINMPSFVIDFDGDLANFEVFYKDPASTVFTQLKKRMVGSVPIKEPFCYYKVRDENRIEISFSTRDNYFQPKFNSELMIDWYTSLGSKGNFPLYKGSDIVIVPGSEEFEFNMDMTIFGIPQSDARFGADKLTMEQLRTMVIEKYSTVNSYTNENDLQLYFDSFNSKYNTDVLFVKKRDDFYRQFTSFSKLKKTNGDIFWTNTLTLDMKDEDFSAVNTQSDSYLLKPGKLFKYKPGTNDTVVPLPDTLDGLSKYDNEEFIYSNPFLIYFSKNPTSIGYYMNTVDDKYVVDYKELNDSSLIQFICNSMAVSRDAIMGDDAYTISITISPTTDIDNPIVEEITDEVTGEVTVIRHNTLVVRLFIIEGENTLGFIDLELSDYSIDDNIYTYTGKIITDDFVTLSNKMRVSNLYSPTYNEDEYEINHKMIPMNDCEIHVQLWYKADDGTEIIPKTDPEAPYNITNYIRTNTYSTETNPVSFISPIKMMDSRTSFSYNNDGTIGPGGVITGGTYNLIIDSFPLIHAGTLKDHMFSKELYSLLNQQFDHMTAILENITNNFSVDMKFYNTYGKSRTFLLGDESDRLLDRVNITLSIQIRPIFGMDEEILVRDLKIFIKDYVETINEGGTNALYISNLIQAIENEFPNVKYMKFVSLNGLPSDIQALENRAANLDLLSKSERMHYIPEYLTISLEDISIEII